MAISPLSVPVPSGALLLPYQTQPGLSTALVQHILVHPRNVDADLWQKARAVASQIGWKEHRSDPFPAGDLLVSGVRPSRTQRRRIHAELDSLVPVCQTSDVAEVVAAWTPYLDRYRGDAARLAIEAVNRKKHVDEEAARRAAAFNEEMQRWVAEHGSARLRSLISAGERPLGLYRNERRDQEFPGLFIDTERTAEVEVLAAPTPAALGARLAVEEHADWHRESEEPLTFEVVRIDRAPKSLGFDLVDSSEAVRVRGWLERYDLFGLLAPHEYRGLPWVIDDRYPPPATVNVYEELRLTAYGSAYGVTHPGAQEALRTAAIVTTDTLGDLGPQDSMLVDYMSDEAAKLVDDRFLRRMKDTLLIVGWKLAQRDHLGLSCAAEVLAFAMLFDDAVAHVEISAERSQHVTDADIKRAHADLADARADVLEELLDGLAISDLDVLVPEAEPAWLGWWMPFDAQAGDPSPYIVGSHERDWFDDDGKTASDAVSDLPLPSGPWLPLERDGVNRGLIHVGEAEVLRLGLWDHGGVHWHVERFEDVTALEGGEAIRGGVSRFYATEWEDVLRTIPADLHPWLVDHVTRQVERLWSTRTDRRGGRGPLRALRRKLGALGDAVHLREALQAYSESGLLQDPRVSELGILDASFGRWDTASYEARVPLRPERGRRKSKKVDRDARVACATLLERFSTCPVAISFERVGRGMDLRIAVSATDMGEAYDLVEEVAEHASYLTGLEVPRDAEGWPEVDLSPIGDGQASRA